MKTIRLFTVLLSLSVILTCSILAQIPATSNGNRLGYSGPDNNGIYLSQSTPGIMNQGQSYNISITMKNSGRSTWTQGSYSLKLINNSQTTDRTWNINNVDVNSSVSPGAEIVFNFSVRAPEKEGNYNMQWQMSNGNAFFGEPSKDVPIRVSTTTVDVITPDIVKNNANFVSQTIPAHMDVNETYEAFITMTNSGSAVWTTGVYKLKITSKGDDKTSNNWSVANVELTKDVLIGSEYTFLFKVTAPPVSGKYNFQGQVMKDDQVFGAPSDNVIVKVE